jgi:toxin ParE1/3/4
MGALVGSTRRAAYARMQVVWTQPALSDLAALRAYISEDNPPAADRQVDLIMMAVGGLVTFPESGRPGRRERTRELIIGKTPYLVPYRIRGDRIEVLRVLHGRRRWPIL